MSNIEIKGELNSVCNKAVKLVKYSRALVIREVDIIQVMTYFVLGKWIVEEQQNGDDRAKYGRRVISQLSESLNKELGGGFSTSTLENCRKFYLTYQDRISQPVVREFETQKSQPLATKLKEEAPFKLSWSHFHQLLVYI